VTLSKLHKRSYIEQDIERNLEKYILTTFDKVLFAY